GLQPGDVVTSVNGTPVKNAAEAAAEIAKAGKDGVRFYVNNVGTGGSRFAYVPPTDAK
ncbi:MAG: hypothetical protein JWO31_2070, partial [Phycisphaerales bacterium]|nr:hypothetical protein [Phycisphaerales bacterium]